MIIYLIRIKLLLQTIELIWVVVVLARYLVYNKPLKVSMHMKSIFKAYHDSLMADDLHPYGSYS